MRAAHDPQTAVSDLDDGITKFLNDGYVSRQAAQKKSCSGSVVACNQYQLGVIHHDAMGYHTDAEIPNYWAYAKNFVLQDHMFEGVRSWSLPSHLDLVSEWSATCTDPKQASTCTSSLLPLPISNQLPTFPWVNLFQLLDQGGISWKYYVQNGLQPDCDDDAANCLLGSQSADQPSKWNPVGLFTYVQNKGSAYRSAHNPGTGSFFTDVQSGTLPLYRG